MASIESYKPFHIGIKLKSRLPSIKEDLKNALKEDESYKVIDETSASPFEIISPIAKKGDVNIGFNNEAGSLNIVGNSPSEVGPILKELRELLSSKLEYEPTATIFFYEVVTNIIIKTEKKPHEVMTKKLKSMSSIWVDTGIYSLGIAKKNKQPADTNWFEITTLPYPNNPSNHYLSRCVFRSEDVIEIETFCNTLEQKIINLVTKLEEE